MNPLKTTKIHFTFSRARYNRIFYADPLQNLFIMELTPRKLKHWMNDKVNAM